MIRTVIFCEGRTERALCERLVQHIMGNAALIEVHSLSGPQYARITARESTQVRQPTHEYYVLIVDCGGGGIGCVQSDILEQHESLIRNGGYTAIIGVRDIYPEPLSKVEEMRRNAYRLVVANPVPNSPAKVTHVFAVMETEAWFLAECEHYQRIDERLTVHLIKSKLAFDPKNGDMQVVPHPSVSLNEAYRLVGKSYLKNGEKKGTKIRRTVGALDMRNFVDLGKRYAPICELVTAIAEVIRRN
jgi:hypothetical protein